MRRWNGWGDVGVSYPLPDSALIYLKDKIGPSTPPHDADLFEVVASVPENRLPSHELVSEDTEERLRHARGQSFPDWVEMRSGRVATFPDGVSYPLGDHDVRELIRYAKNAAIRLIPYGGGTSVVGHINPLPGETPVLTVDMHRLNRLRGLDEVNQIATFGAGVSGPDLEAQLRANGYTLGHFPQSFEYSTLGGWIATHSSGQQSLKYGRIGDLFAGGRLETTLGTMIMPNYPASAAGPDLRAVVLGSEGRFGIITEVAVRVTNLPEREDFHAVFFPNWEAGYTAVKKIVQARLLISMLRLSTPTETETTLALAGHDLLISTLETLLSVRGAGEEKCLLLIGFTGSDALVKFSRKETLGISRSQGGIHIGRAFGSQWHKSRFKTPYLRNTLWELGYGVDTLETATSWENVHPMMNAIEGALESSVEESGEKVHVFTHLSHVYPSGSSIYTTYLFRLATDPDENLERWSALKTAASQAIVAQGGTISHQHGIGMDHKAYLSAEKGPVGIDTLRSLCDHFDPGGIMNPGKLV